MADIKVNSLSPSEARAQTLGTKDLPWGGAVIDGAISDGNGNNITPKQMVDKVSDAPKDGEKYIRKDGEWIKINDIDNTYAKGYYNPSGLFVGAKAEITPPDNIDINLGENDFRLRTIQKININNAATWDVGSNATAANRAGKDFYIYSFNNAGVFSFILSANATVPSAAGATAANTRKLGGFHCLGVAVGTIAGHPLSGYVAGDILPASVWDLNHRPHSSPEGMVYSDLANAWVDIYFADANGKSAYGATILNNKSWVYYAELLGSNKKKFLNDQEFQLIARGSNENSVIAGNAFKTVNSGYSDTANRRMISNIGCESMCGHYFQFLSDTAVFALGVGDDLKIIPEYTNRGKRYASKEVDGKLMAGYSATSDGASAGSMSRAGLGIIYLNSQVTARGCSAPKPHRF